MFSKILPPAITCLFLGLGVSSQCGAWQSWSQFRGDRGNGIAQSTTILTSEFDLATEQAWQTEIPGIGWSSPVIDDQRAWMTTAIATAATPEKIEAKLQGVEVPEIKTVAESVELRAICVDLETGAMIRNFVLAHVDQPEIINPLNSYASPTPALRDGVVVCHFGAYGTWGLDQTTGEILWKRKFLIDHSVGPGSSPVIYRDRVILVCDGMDRQFIACVDLKTGKDLWQTERPPIRAENGELKKSFSTPLLIQVGQQDLAVIPSAQWIVAYDPNDGREVWRVDHGSGYSIAPVPTFENGLVISATGYGQPAFLAIDPTGSGDVTQTHVRWRVRNAPAMSSFIGHQGKIYAVNDGGVLMCIDVASGEVLTRTRLGGNYSASPVLANEQLYFFSREGYVSIVACNPELTLIKRINLESQIMASPAIIGNDLILRTKTSLHRIGKRNPDSNVPDSNVPDSNVPDSNVPDTNSDQSSGTGN